MRFERSLDGVRRGGVVFFLMSLAIVGNASPGPTQNDSRLKVGEFGGSVRKFRIPEHDFFPESIAHDPMTGDYFLGSMSQSRILRIHRDGSYEEFLNAPVSELESSVGVKVDAKRRVLWVCSGRFSLFEGSPRSRPRTGLLRFDLETGELLASWCILQESPYHIFNDVEIAGDGSLYATTTLIGSTFRVAPDLGEITRLHQLRAGSHNNGVTLGPAEKHLFVAVDRGIRRYEVGGGSEVLEIEIPALAGVGPDGLYYHDGSLIMVQPRANQVARLVLNEERTAVDRFDVLARDHPDFAYPTTGVLVEDSLVFVASSYADRPRRPGIEAQHGDVFVHEVSLR